MENENEVQSGDLLLNFFDFLTEYFVDVNKKKPSPIDELKCKLINLAVANAYDDTTRQGAYNALFSTRHLKIAQKNVDEKKERSKTAKRCAIKALINGGNKEKEKERFDGINRLLDPKKIDKYDKWHENLCEGLMDIYKSNELNDLFTYGNAQKWVNMTVKYLYIFSYMLKNMAEFSGENNPLIGILNYTKEFHIPLDNYVLKAMSNKKGLKDDEQLNGWINCIRQEGDNQYNICYKKEDDEQCSLIKAPKSIRSKKGERKTAWSNIESYSLYFQIQKMLRDNIPITMFPLEWENKVWLDEKK